MSDQSGMGRSAQAFVFLVTFISLSVGFQGQPLAQPDETCGEPDIQWDNPDPKELFRQVSQVALCARTQQIPEIVARVTDAYADRAKSPPCHIVLWNAEAHRTLAQRLSNLRLPGPSQRGEARLHWELARDGFEAISRAGDKAANNKQVLTECVNPARSSLAMYPQVTIRLEPLESEGQVLQWNEEIITDAKPRVTPGQHQLAVNPPIGSSMKIFVNSVPQRVLRGVVPVNVEYGDKLEILVRFYDGEIASEDDPDKYPDPLAIHGEGEGGGSVLRPILIWSGIGLGVLSASLATWKFIDASNWGDKADELNGRGSTAGCADAAPADPALCASLGESRDHRYDRYDTSMLWGGIWTGIGVAGFTTAIIAAVVMDSGDEEEEAALPLQVGVVAAPGITALSVSGTF
jgi:hypothetical protein